MDLVRGYTSVKARQGGLGGGRLHPRARDVLPEGPPHAVIRGESESLCGRAVIHFLEWPPSSFEKLCPRCAEERDKLEASA